MRFSVILLLLVFALTESAHGQIVRPAEIKLQFHRAERAFRSGASPHEAKRRLDIVLAELPEDGEALLLRARVLLQLGQPLEALADARRAVQVMPESGEAHLIQSEAAREAGMVDEAMTALSGAAARITGGADLHVRLSVNARMLGDLDQAEAYARLAQAQDPALPAAHLQLARVFTAKNRPDAAATVLQGALQAGILSPIDVSADPELATVTNHPDLNRWFNRR